MALREEQFFGRRSRDERDVLNSTLAHRHKGAL